MTTSVSTERQNKALTAIKSLYGKAEGEYGPTLFVQQHIEAFEANDWEDILGTEAPTPEQVLGALVLVDSWSSEDDDNLDVYDFSLPGDVTNYLLSVRFGADDVVAEVSLES